MKFSDGVPLTAADVVCTMTRLRTDDTLAARSSLAEVTETRIESGRVVLRTARPSARFVYDLTKVLIVRAGSTRASLEARPNGTGPYAVESFAPGRRLRLRRHEAYWGPKPVFPRVDIEMNADELTRLALLAGDFPVILRGRLAAAEQAASEGTRYRVVRQPSLYLFVLGLSVSSPTIPMSRLPTIIPA